MKILGSHQKTFALRGLFVLAVLILATAMGHAFGGLLLMQGDLVIADGGLLQVKPDGSQKIIVSGNGCCGGQAVVLDRRTILATAGSPARIVRVNSLLGTIKTVSSGQFFVSPNSVALEPTGAAVVTDHGIPGVLRLDLSSGVQTVVSKNGNFVAPLSLTVASNGDIFVADSAAFDGHGGVIKVNPNTGEQKVISSGGNFYDPTGIVLDLNGDILVADPAGVAHQGGGPGRIIRVNPTTGAQSVVSSAKLLVDPWGITVAKNGFIYVTDPVGFSSSAQVLRIEPTTGAQEKVATGPLFGPTAIEIFERD